MAFVSFLVRTVMQLMHALQHIQAAKGQGAVQQPQPQAEQQGQVAS